MALINTSHLDPTSVANPCQPESNPTAPPHREKAKFEETNPRSPGWGRRFIVFAMGTTIAVAAFVLIGMTFMQGSWWYSYGTDQALDQESRVRVEVIRDKVKANGAMTEVVAWLDEALDPQADSSAVRYYLLAAHEALKATDDPKLVEATGELWAIIQTTQPHPVRDAATPSPMPTLKWPW
ncbi:MAG: hypothetical protein SXV54_27395 [Chloroflexota bacterium]|nr:hypothetical protein [Chloroflexota bacterium]